MRERHFAVLLILVIAVGLPLAWRGIHIHERAMPWITADHTCMIPAGEFTPREIKLYCYEPYIRNYKGAGIDKTIIRPDVCVDSDGWAIETLECDPCKYDLWAACWDSRKHHVR